MQPLEQGSCEFPYKEWMQVKAVVDKTKNKYRGRGESSKVKSPDEVQDQGNNGGESDPNPISQSVQDQTHDPAQKAKEKQDGTAEVEWSEVDAICIKSDRALMAIDKGEMRKVSRKILKSGKTKMVCKTKVLKKCQKSSPRLGKHKYGSHNSSQVGKHKYGSHTKQAHEAEKSGPIS